MAFEPTSGSTVELRNYRWKRMANILYMESPVGVGFTYSDTGSYFNNDTRTVNMNFEALESFFAGFPEYLDNDFYIMGESYAGIYIPTLAMAILQAGSQFNGPTLKGIAVGNGCSGTSTASTCALAPYCTGAQCDATNSAIMPGACLGYKLRTQYLSLASSAPLPVRNAVGEFCDFSNVTIDSTLPQQCGLSDACMANITAMFSYFTAVDFYDIYGLCVNMNMSSSPGESTSCVQQGNPIFDTFVSFNDMLRQQNHYEGETSRKLDTASGAIYGVDDDTGATFDTPYWQSLGSPAVCYSQGPEISEYLNNPEFIAAVHAQEQSYCWGMCNTASSFTYVRQEANEPADVYPYLISRIKVLIYNGDFDAVVPYNDNYEWTTSVASAHGLPFIQPWHTWQYTARENNSTQAGGYAMKWNVSGLTPGTGDFEFRTVRGAGHTVPQDTPDKAYQIFAHFIGVGNQHYFFPEPASECASAQSSSSSNTGPTYAAIIFGVLFGCTFAALAAQTWRFSTLSAKTQSLLARSDGHSNL